MATTKAKESSLGKERKITAPSSVTIPNTPTKRTPKSSPRGPSDHKLPSFSSPSPSTPFEKHVPNYLKSTASSRHDHNHNHTFKPVKKPAPIPEGRPSLNRRRSFDKPPPTAPRLDKPFRSPGPRCRASHVPIRSSSFGAKPVTFVSSAKPGFLERSVSKISKVGKPQQPVQTLKSSGNAKKSLKKEPSNATSTLAEMVPKTKITIEHVDQCSSMVLGVNEEDLKKIECELDCYLPDPMPELDKELRADLVEKKVDVLDKEAGQKDEVEKKLHHHQPIQNIEIFKVVATNKEVEETPSVAETENPEEAEAKSSIQEEENRDTNERVGEEEAKDEEKAEGSAEEKEVVVAVVESEEHENDNKEEKIAMEEKSETDQKWEGGEGIVEEENNNSMTNAEAAEKVAVAAAAEKEAEAAAEKVAATAGKQRQGGGPGRKESPAMYNDVIEETASKLLEKRKNKVKALAGAFQTVIDYESSSK